MREANFRNSRDPNIPRTHPGLRGALSINGAVKIGWRFGAPEAK